MTIQKYEDWMRAQVVALFNLEYGTPLEEFDVLFGAFYEHPFQKEQCIRIVAVDGERVAGFQSFFYWPVTMNGKTLRSYQSGNSLVHPDYRGKGLFGKMLNFIHEPTAGFDCELLIGFPVEASYNSFRRNQWLNPFNLEWHVKMMNPVRSLLSRPEIQLRKRLSERVKSDFKPDPQLVLVDQDQLFDDYRFAYEKGDFYRYTYQSGKNSAFFEMKAQRRKEVIKELVIGKFISSVLDEKFIKEAFDSLLKVILRSANFAMVSCAINSSSAELKAAITACGFRKIDRSIYFIAKGPVADQVKDWSNWWMFRSDIDTW